jgi:prepilin-type N-terminal cleavage/methylation domain-containing protein
MVMGFALTKFARTAFTLVEIMIAVAVIVLLVAIAIPGFLRARKRSQVAEIHNDLRLIDPAVKSGNQVDRKSPLPATASYV